MTQQYIHFLIRSRSQQCDSEHRRCSWITDLCSSHSRDCVLFFFTYDKVLHLFRLSFFFYVLPSFEERSQNIQVLPLQLCDLSAYSFYLPCFAFFGLQHITCFSFFFRLQRVCNIRNNSQKAKTTIYEKWEQGSFSCLRWVGNQIYSMCSFKKERRVLTE